MTYGSNDTIIARTGVSAEDLGFEETTDDLDQFLTDLRDRATSAVVEYTGRTFELITGEEDRLDGNGRRVISTRQSPVRQIHEVRAGGKLLDPSEYTLVSTRGRSDVNTGRIRRERGVWGRSQRIRVDYDWGYGPAHRPAVVDDVVEDMVVETIQKAEIDRSAAGKQSESMDGYSVTWQDIGAEDYLRLTESMRERLQPLRRGGAV